MREVCDTLEDQLIELLVTRQPALKQNPAALAEQVEAYVNGRDWEQCGVWVWYPWRQTMVHVLDQEDFIELRTNRNRNRITREEQALLRQKNGWNCRLVCRELIRIVPCHGKVLWKTAFG